MNFADSNCTKRLTDLSVELAELRQVAPRLAQRVAESAGLMRETGARPAFELIEELQFYCTRIDRLADELKWNRHGDPVRETVDGEVSVPPDSTFTFDRMQLLIEGVRYVDVTEAVRDQLTRLAHVDQQEFEPLAHCRREAARLCEAASHLCESNEATELELLDSNRHPLNFLLRLAHDGEQLADHEWTECHDHVAAAYGRQLATALTRGRIQPVTLLSTTPMLDHDDEDHVDPPDVLTPIDTGTRPSTPTEDSADSIFGGHEVEFKSQPQATALMQSSETSVKVELERIRMEQAATDARCARVSQQVIRLMTDDRLALACQLIQCLERRPEPSLSLPPSWLLRALVLGRHLSDSKGKITFQLDDELRNFRSDLLTEGDAERQTMMGFLLRAAAIPAALLTRSSTAAAILRSFKISPGLSQTYNYCTRIGLYGDRLGGNLAQMFRPAGTMAGAAELEDLAVVARNWLQTTARKQMSYRRSSPLFLHAHWTVTAGTAGRHAESTRQWCKWQETLLLAKRLLKPVCEGLEGERQWARREIHRLTSQIEIGPQNSAQKVAGLAGLGGRPIVLPLEEMRATVHEAIEIANRWLRICDQAGPGGASPIPQEALELRSELLQRSDAAIDELIQLRRTTESPLVKAAIACTQAAVRRIQALFESKITLPVFEPEPARILNADLLRVPMLELNDRWCPDAEPAAIENGLLDALEQPEISWRQSYDLHAQSEDHESTGKLLELDVWKSSTERETLRVDRERKITEVRSMLATEINDIAVEFARNPQFARLAESDRSFFLQRLESLRRDLSRVVNFGPYRHRLGQLLSSAHRQIDSKSVPVVQATNGIDSVEPSRPASSESSTMDGGSPDQDSILFSNNIFTGE